MLRVEKEAGMCLLSQNTIEAFMRMPDIVKSLKDILQKVKDASRLLSRLQVGSINLALSIFPAGAGILSSQRALPWPLLRARQCSDALMQAEIVPEINT
jgi:hypothetical protein